MKSTVQTVSVCLFLSFVSLVQAQTPLNHLTFVSANDTSVTFIPKYRGQYPEGFYFDTARMEFVVQIYPFADTATIAHIGYTDTSFTSPVTVGGLSPSTTYNLLAYGMDINWNNMGQFGQNDFVFTTTGPVGLNDVPEIQFSIYPNPATDILIVNGNIENEQLRLFDLIGKMILQKQVNHSQIDVDVSGLPAGTYILCIGTNRRKIIVDHE